MGMLNTAAPVAAQAPAAATDAVITLATPPTGTRWKIRSIIWSYSAAPTGGSLVIAWTGGTMTIAITAGGHGQLTFPNTLELPTDVSGTITLKSGAGAVVGTVYADAVTSGA